MLQHWQNKQQETTFGAPFSPFFIFSSFYPFFIFAGTLRSLRKLLHLSTPKQHYGNCKDILYMANIWLVDARGLVLLE